MRRLVRHCGQQLCSSRRLLRGLAPIAGIVGALAVLAAIAAPAGAAPPGIGGLVSPSQPVATRWYKSPNPTLAWQGVIATPAVAGYSYVLDRFRTNIPDVVVDLPYLTFSSAKNYSAGTYPDTIAAGDLNRDGKPDLVVINGNSTPSVSVLLGKGNGAFGAPHNFAIAAYGPNKKALAIADLNHDGKPDIIAASDYGHISVLLGKGNGTFLPRHDYAGGSGQGLAIAELSGDHNFDIVVADHEGVSVLLGRGDGRFLPKHQYYADPPADVISLALGDLNGDGKKDVIVGSATVQNTPEGSFSVLIGKGNGAFKSAVTRATTAYIPYSIGVGYLDQDSKQDLVIGNEIAVDLGSDEYYGSVNVWRGNGNGTFAAGAEYATGYQNDPGSVSIADFNTDGHVDVAATLATGVAVFLGNGDATLKPPVAFPIGFTSSPYRNALVVRDLTRDGRPDLAIAFGNGHAVSVLVNRSTKATYLGCADGVWYFHVRAVDATAAGGPTASRAVRIDTQRPSSSAPHPASVKSGGTASLTYSVSDPQPSAGWCKVVIVVKNGHGTVVLRRTYAHATCAVSYHTTFHCSLAKGTYRFYVYAADAAGNTQAKLGWNKLVVH